MSLVLPMTIESVFFLWVGEQDNLEQPQFKKNSSKNLTLYKFFAELFFF